MRFMLQYRKKVERNTDPQRRCYNGCHFSSDIEWTDWEDICLYRNIRDAISSKRTFQGINKEREYRIMPG